eukprot:Blabericola_migrator_1__8988@NODE_4785_length_981_cov_98_464989_g189_i2_p1_GENE_NODE_4785_length_981_cov_98_464989_g189_i2NODE_4785_length_981_cov_98_464989_g189_i2_p1_ORF_typecomplete_len309_score38_72_NODE_4785_length_981_cov_98_464989_g189_i253919
MRWDIACDGWRSLTPGWLEGLLGTHTPRSSLPHIDGPQPLAIRRIIKRAGMRRTARTQYDRHLRQPSGDTEMSADYVPARVGCEAPAQCFSSIEIEGGTDTIFDLSSTGTGSATGAVNSSSHQPSTRIPPPGEAPPTPPIRAVAPRVSTCAEHAEVCIHCELRDLRNLQLELNQALTHRLPPSPHIPLKTPEQLDKSQKMALRIDERSDSRQRGQEDRQSTDSGSPKRAGVPSHVPLSPFSPKRESIPSMLMSNEGALLTDRSNPLRRRRQYSAFSCLSPRSWGCFFG